VRNRYDFFTPTSLERYTFVTQRTQRWMVPSAAPETMHFESAVQAAVHDKPQDDNRPQAFNLSMGTFCSSHLNTS
jgi:hypothetical protein